jgi:deoxyribonuclease-4
MDFISSNNINIGGHIGFSRLLSPTIVEAYKYGMKTVQFFLGNPKAFKRQRLNDKEIEMCCKLCAEHSISTFSHYPYTSSLVGSVASLAWNGDEIQDKKTENILQELEYEINTLGRCCGNRCGTVVHPGSFKNRDDGLITIGKSINKINFENHSKLLLENSAAQGTTLPKNLNEFVKIFDVIDSSKKNNVGICLDTAHIWGSAMYDLTKRDEIDKLFHDFDSLIGLDKFSLLHLNDSMVEFGSRKDRHESLGDGFIWSNDISSLKYLLMRCSENKIPVILETPNIIRDLEVVRNFEF